MEIDAGQLVLGFFSKFIDIVKFGETAPEFGTKTTRGLAIINSDPNNKLGFRVG